MNIEKLNDQMGAWIKKFRISLILNQSEFAEVTGIDQGNLSDMENGLKRVTGETILAIEYATGKDLSTLYHLHQLWWETKNKRKSAERKRITQENKGRFKVNRA